ncbi:hypothetical protein [Nannocystis sp. SCPEA4]|uniref:hypothetical protein n=1 Tax=Nannocystis sp. SCPEA4 TaxID=2996787 RepID=UPI00226FD5F5|nr:hypothetical protein [Nannocystis sp. SCPEA4]MCY1056629.1 hypothetical protein [Nannocystis sp. SCPEA4]
MPSARQAVLVTCALAACGGPDPSASTSFGVGTLPPLSGTTSSTSSSSLSSTSSTSGLGTETSSSGTAGGPLLDLGIPDLGNGAPPGCRGKIDFLFVISGHGFMSEIQNQLVDAFPKFISTIKAKFADFDYHIMVVDGDPIWGHEWCNGPPCPDPACEIPDFPSCDMIASRTVCDFTMGAGTVFNAGSLAPNVPCNLPEGRRYLTRDDPDLDSTFACMAQVGESGRDYLNEALVRAISPDLTEPGGCNDGFLRDDALLMVTFITITGDGSLTGTIKGFKQAVLDAKGGDPDAVVMFAITSSPDKAGCEEALWDRVCLLIRLFPYWHAISWGEPDYAPGFEVATDLVVEACSQFIPG